MMMIFFRASRICRRLFASALSFVSFLSSGSHAARSINFARSAFPPSAPPASDADSPHHPRHPHPRTHAVTLTRDTKDTLMVTDCGAESIAFMKVYGVLPAAAGFIALYSKMAAVLENNKSLLFYATAAPFFIFFLLFDKLIYPNKEALQPSLESVVATLGSSGVVSKIVANWTSALYYVVSELYSSVSIGVLFWGYANSVIKIEEAGRFYPLFGQMSSLGPIAAGQYVVHYASKVGTFQESLDRLTASIIFSGIMICCFHAASEKLIASREVAGGGSSSSAAAAAKAKSKSKPKMGMLESFKFLSSSPYLRLLAALVVGYGLSINFTEIIWKSLVKKLYPSALEYQHFMGTFSSAVGVTTFFVIFLGGNVIKHLGWKVGALATPTIMSVLALPFFSCLLLGGVENTTSLKIAVMIGTAQSLLTKATKYALFDPTTQMAYIPLDEESKVKGKAAIDVLGSRLGKSGGSLIQQVLVFAFGNIVDAGWAVAAIFYSVLFVWMNSASKLSIMFRELSDAGPSGKKAK